MTEKLLFVSCQVPQSRLWELLRLLEVAKCGNVEVRPVAPSNRVGPSEIFPEIKKDKRGAKPRVRDAVARVMTMHEVRRPMDVALETGANPKSVYSALSWGVKSGIYKKKGNGFERVKEDAEG